MTYLDTPVDSDLQKSLQSALDLNSSFNRQLREKDAQFSSVKDIILEAFDVDEFDKDTVIAIAEVLEIELTEEVNITAKVLFSGTVTVPRGFDVENDLETYIEFEATVISRGREDVECDLCSDSVKITVDN
jgi:hypothetical protein